MKQTKAIIFDYGNVIEGPIDEAAFQADLAELAAEYGFAKGIDLWLHLYASPAWEKAKRGQISRTDFWDDRLGALGILTEEERFAFKSRLFRNRGLRPGMRELLDELKERYCLALLSNTSRLDFARYIAEQRGLGNIFDVVVSSAEEGVAKPDLAIYRIVLTRLEIEPHEALFIDDLLRNTAAAEAIGIPSIVFTSVQALRAELEQRGILESC